MSTYTVIQWSTGNVGLRALDAIFDNPQLDLVGLWVHSDAKVGRDAGEMVGRPACGVTATNDVEALLALGADAVCYTASGETRPQEALADICEILASGVNVVSSSMALLHPRTADRAFIEPLEQACQEGQASCFFSGIDPGFANDVLPMVLSGVSQRITQVRARELFDYSTYEVPEVLFDMLGFGQALDSEPLVLLPGVLAQFWGGTMRVLAEALGVELDSIEEWHERRALDVDIDNVAGRTVEAGTQAGLRWQIRGMVDGADVIVCEHVSRLHADVAPDWPEQHGDGGYQITISGEPRIECTFEAYSSDGERNGGGLIVTATKLLNAIPAVVEAPPGVLSANDFPIPTGKGLVSR